MDAEQEINETLREVIATLKSTLEIQSSLLSAVLALSRDPGIDRKLLLSRYDEARAELNPNAPDILRGETGQKPAFLTLVWPRPEDA